MYLFRYHFYYWKKVNDVFRFLDLRYMLETYTFAWRVNKQRYAAGCYKSQNGFLFISKGSPLTFISKPL